MLNENINFTLDMYTQWAQQVLRRLFHLQFYFIHRFGENNIREGYINTVQRSKISESLAHYIVVRPIRKKYFPGPASIRILFSLWREFFYFVDEKVFF